MNIPDVVTLVNDDIIIDYKSILNVDSEVDLSEFEKVGFKKRSYKNRAEEIHKSLVEMLEKMELGKDFYEEFFSYTIMCKLNDQPIKDFKACIDKLCNILKEPINIFVDNEIDPVAYTSQKSIEEMETRSKRELYFSNDHLKRLIKVSILSKFLLLHVNNLDLKYRKGIMRKIIIDKMWSFNFIEEDKQVNISNKIQKLAFSRLLTVIYSDRRFWNIAKFHNIKALSYANDLFYKITSEIIMFLDYNANPIPYLDVYIVNNITWLKKKKFNHKFDVVNTYQQDRKFDAMQEHSSLNFNNMRISTNVIVNETILQFLNKELEEPLKDEYYRNLLDKISNNFNRNVIHNYIVFPLISKKLSISVERLLNIDKNIFSLLILYTVIEMNKHNFYLLSQLLLANITTDRLNIKKEAISNYKNIKSIVQSCKYKTLIHSKHILKIIAVLYYNKFESFIGKKKNVIKFSADEIGKEVLTFMELLL